MNTTRPDAVRPATVEDAVTLGRLLYDFNTEFGTPTPGAAEFASRFRGLLSGEDTEAFLSEDDRGEATGFALVSLRSTPYFDGPLVQLEELYVLPGLRDRGIGTRLLDAVVACAQDRGSEEVHIGVDEMDTDTRRFYERHGFTNIVDATSEVGDGTRDFRMLLYLREL
ncbi:MAG TPA: GNAT family N-acetyltransferase [Candidatus Corynebacterium avicola]|uniref:GNAT family N-acetyltransferase n=1 Tax=Candidatus Corynebacterium avicola TaxID=2838527 RepID=A0A9D1RMX5_9CORY|nr:GNAT family N-acetyltransferase [Candidatus Corynebacterium avicola]